LGGYYESLSELFSYIEDGVEGGYGTMNRIIFPSMHTYMLHSTFFLFFFFLEEAVGCREYSLCYGLDSN
jgi:hypothetical protein